MKKEPGSVSNKMDLKKVLFDPPVIQMPQEKKKTLRLLIPVVHNPQAHLQIQVDPGYLQIRNLCQVVLAGTSRCDYDIISYK